MTPSAPDSRNRSPLLPLRASSIPVIYLTVIEQFSVPLLPFLSVIAIVYEYVPAVVGVPEIVPPVDMLNPAGSPVAVKV